MSAKSIRRCAVRAAAAACLAVTLGACGSSDPPDAPAAAAGGDGAAAADVAAAREALAPYTGKPSAFPVDEPLPRRLPAGTRLAYLQCATPICGIFSQIMPAAAEAVGAEFEVVRAGASATQLQSAFDSLLEREPSAVLLPAVEPATVGPQLQRAQDAGLPVSANGIMDGEDHGIDAQMLGRPTAELAGKLLAAWVVERLADDAKPVFYTTPELSFARPIREAFETELERLCSECEARFEDVPVGTIGSTAPARVVSDLEANPDTNVAVFSTQEASTGLPAALRTAGVEVDTVGFAPNPAILQDIKSGGATAGLGLDLAVMSWTQVDAAARRILDAPLTEGQEATIPPMQFLTADDLPGDVSQGWTGYPDFPARFAELWKGE